MVRVPFYFAANSGGAQRPAGCPVIVADGAQAWADGKGFCAWGQIQPAGLFHMFLIDFIPPDDLWNTVCAFWQPYT
ncbi:hypothetical protein [Komagataeibacter sp. FNDCF1]|uniref:hypothetical protein n=1 Tax=Komagataeibacter sp. FNDCF1 TaxID=2878681 RepID=UPI001E506431|nr:hypothetical protein [Komagataeibacter sp. FNDCF1]MCE2564200.1 hypothetical protein [Komagataeibacter sp. FNDCF1]